MTEGKVPARVLTIAGSDSGGGAGVEADLKTFTALGVYGMAAITSVTAQNTLGVHAIHDLTPAFVAKQIDVVAEDIGVDAVKIGMLSNAPIVAAVAATLKEHAFRNVVLDPVMVSSSGQALLPEKAAKVLIKMLLPLVYLITPNRREAEILADRKIENESHLEEAAKIIHEYGPAQVLITGGHFEGEEATDYLYDGHSLMSFSETRIPSVRTHGTGCTYSAAIAAFLAKGENLTGAIAKAKAYVTGAIRHAFPVGKGAIPLNHFWNTNPTEPR